MRLTPDFDRAHSKLGMIHMRLRNIEEAERHLRSAIELNPRLPVALYNLAVICATTGRDPEAEDYFKKTIKMGPKLTQAYLNYAVLLQRRKSFLPARELLDQALGYDPKNADIYFNRGVISEALNLFHVPDAVAMHFFFYTPRIMELATKRFESFACSLAFSTFFCSC